MSRPSRPHPPVLPITIFALLAPAAAPATGADGAWQEVSPPSREFHCAIDDPVRQRMIVVGGSGDNPAGVWTMSLGTLATWTFVPTTGRGAPPVQGGAWTDAIPIWGAAAIYDPVRDRMLVEGTDFSPDNPTFEAVWALALTSMTWSRLTTAGTAPPPRQQHSAIYDAAGDRMITFGGQNGVGVPPNGDAWALSLGGTPTWTHLLPSGGPAPARFAHAAIYDPVRARMVIFGGQDENQSLLNDVWAMSLGGSPAWTQLAPSGTPPAPTEGMGAVYDPVRDRMLITGGGGIVTSGTAGQTWALDFATLQWQKLLSSGAPAMGATAIYDAALDRVVTNVLGLTRQLSLSPSPAWATLNRGPGGPGPLHDFAMAMDAPRTRALVSGGIDPESDVLLVDNLETAGFVVSDSVWRRLDFAIPIPSRPPERTDHTAIVDPVRNAYIEFGGYGGAPGPYRNDVWSMTLVAPIAWTQLAPTGTPPSPRAGHSSIYDPTGDRMLVFGGADGTQSLNDLWSMSLASPQWTPLAPIGTPPSPRQRAAVAYDPQENRMLLFGGEAFDPFFPEMRTAAANNELWSLSLTGPPAWTQLSPTGTPPPPTRDPLLLHDPDRARFEVLTDAGVWALVPGNPPAWQPLDIANAVPPGIERGGAVYDPVNHRVLLAPGDASTLWELRFPAATGVPAAPIAALGLALRGAMPNPAGRGPLTVAFSLPGRGPARLVLYDVAGRELASRDVGSLGAGPHTIELAPAARLAPGVYLVRLSAAGRTLGARVAVVR